MSYSEFEGFIFREKLNLFSNKISEILYLRLSSQLCFYYRIPKSVFLVLKYYNKCISWGGRQGINVKDKRV